MMIGSVTTGRKVMQKAAKNLAPILLESGGKSLNIVFPDADLDLAVKGAISGMSLTWEGQFSGSGSRLLVHDDVYDEVVADVVAGFEAVRAGVGDPFDESSKMGSIVSKPQFEKVTHYMETAKEEGATTLTGGEVINEFDTGFSSNQPYSKWIQR